MSMSDFLDNVIAACACGEGSMRGLKEFSRLIWFTVKNHSLRYGNLEGRRTSIRGSIVFGDLFKIGVG